MFTNFSIFFVTCMCIAENDKNEFWIKCYGPQIKCVYTFIPRQLTNNLLRTLCNIQEKIYTIGILL